MAGRVLIRVGDPTNGRSLGPVPGMILMELIEEGKDCSSTVSVDDIDAVFDELGVNDCGAGLASVFG